LGDYVYCTNNRWLNHKENSIYQIIGIDLLARDNPSCSFPRLWQEPYRLKSIEDAVFLWSSLTHLTIVPDYKVAAIKYNI